MASPAFQFYPDDFLGSGKVGIMRPAEIGVYILLLCLDWNETGFEYDADLLARWCRTTEAEFTEAWKLVGRCFREREGRFYNPRLEKERVKQASWRAKSQAGAAVTNAKRWGRGGDEVANGVASPSGRTPFPSPALATTGRSRALNGNGTPPATTTPAVAFAPQWCAHCGDGVLVEVGGSKRPVRRHAEDCPR